MILTVEHHLYEITKDTHKHTQYVYVINVFNIYYY